MLREKFYPVVNCARACKIALTAAASFSLRALCAGGKRYSGWQDNSDQGASLLRSEKKPQEVLPPAADIG